MFNYSVKPLVLSISVLLITGCNMAVKPVKNSTQLDNTYKELHQILNVQKPINSKITLPDAIARALKYNLEHRVQQAQVSLEYGNLEMAYLAMFPNIDAGINYSFRNNNYIQNFVDQTGQSTKGTAIAEPRDILTENAGLQWSVLDFGLSYMRAQKQANTLLMAEEQRRRTTQKLIQEVTGAYWKAWAAQEMSAYVLEVKNKAEVALKRSKNISSRKASPPQSELVYQQMLIKNIRKINRLTIQIHDAKSNLLALMNAKVGKNFLLSAPYENIKNLPEIYPQFEKMDMLALVYRPELREASYQSANAKKDIHEAIMSMLPILEFDFGYNHTNNNYLYNKDWWQGNIGASWNIMKAVTSGPKGINLASHGYSLAKMQQAAATMTILTQIRVAYYAYKLQREDYIYASQEYAVAKGLSDYARKLEKSKSGNEQKTIRRYIDRLSAQFEKEVTFSRAQESLSRLYQTVGIDMLPPNYQALPLDLLVKAVDKMLKEQSSGAFNQSVDAQYALIEPEVRTVRKAIEEQELSKLDSAQLMLSKQMSDYAIKQKEILAGIVALHSEENNELSAVSERKLKAIQKNLRSQTYELEKINDEIDKELREVHELKSLIITNYNDSLAELTLDHQRKLDGYNLKIEDMHAREVYKNQKNRENRNNEIKTLQESLTNNYVERKETITEKYKTGVSDINYKFDNRLIVLSNKHRYKKDSITNDYSKLQRELSREYRVGTIDESSYRAKKAAYINQESSDLSGENLFYTQDVASIKKEKQKLISTQERDYKNQISLLTKEYNQKLKVLPSMRAKHVQMDQSELNDLEAIRKDHAKKIADYKNEQKQEITNLNDKKAQDLSTVEMRYNSVKLKLKILEERRDSLEVEHKKVLKNFAKERERIKLAQNSKHKSQVESHNNRISEQGKIHAAQKQDIIERKSQVKKEYGG